MADQLAAAEALFELKLAQDQLRADMGAASKLITGELQKIEAQTKNTGLAGLGKQIEDFAKATQAAQAQIQALKFGAIADEVNMLTSALKGADSGVQVAEDLSRAEQLLEERFAAVRAEIQRQAESQRGLVDEEVLLERTTLQLEAAQRQHDTALATVRGRAIQAAEGIAQLAQEEQASALAAQNAWEATARLAIEQDKAEQASALAAQNAWEATARLAIEQDKAEQAARALAAEEQRLADAQERNARIAKDAKEVWSGAQIAFGLVSKAVVAVAGAMAAAEAAAVALTVRTVEQGDELNRLSSQYGVAVETLAGMKQAFKDNNLEASDLNTALRQFSNVLGEAMAGGDKAIATVSALGIDISKLKDGTLSTEQAFRIAVDSLAGMTEGYGRASIAQDAFGRAGSKIPVIFKDGAKSLDEASRAASEMGNSFNVVEQQAVAKLDDAMDELSNRVSGLGASIGKELMPVAADIVREANEWIKANRELLKQDVRAFVEGLRDGMKSLLPIVKSVTEALGFIGDVMAGISGPAKQSFAALVEEEKRLVAETEDAAKVFRLFHPLTKELGDSADYAGQHYNALQAQLGVVRSKIAATLDPTKKATLSLADLQRVTDDEARAALEAAKAHGKAAPVIASTGDAAKKAAKKLAEEAKSLADSADKATEYAQSQLELAAATGDMQRVQDAYIVTMAAAREAYERSITAADAAAKAGKSDAEVQNMRTEALRQYVTTAQGAAGTLAKIGAEQIKAAQDLSKYTADLTIARDQDALSMASAKDVGELYTKTLVDIGERLKAEREEIEAKRGVTISAAEADKLLMEAEERAAQEISKAGAAAAKAGAQLSKMDQIIDDLAGHLAEVSLDLGLALLGGQLSWKEAGKQLAADFAKEALDELKAVLLPSVKSLFTSMLSSLIPGASSIGSGVGQAAGSSILSGILGPISKAGSSIAGSLANAISPGITSEAAALGMGGGEALVTSMADSILSLLPTSAAGAVGGALGAAGVVAAAVAGVAGIGVAIAAAFGAFEGPTIVQQIARSLSKMLRKSFENDQIRSAIDVGLQAVDLYLGAGLEKLMVQAPKKMGAQVAEAWKALGSDSSYQFSDGFYQDMRERGAQLIHSSVDDVMHALYPAIAPALYDSIENASIAAGTAIAAGLGLVGDKATKFAEEWAVAFVGMMQAAGKSAEEIEKALKRIDASLGTSAELKRSFDALRDALINAGVDMNALFDNISAQIGKVNGKKVHIGDLDDVLAATGNNATVALGMIENGLDALRVPIEHFRDQLSDVVLAISGDAGTAIREASSDMESFGNVADGTAQLLEQKVVTALGDVVATAAKLDYSAESVQALGTAASLISPELLKSDAVVQALHDSFAQMAVGAHMSIRELVDSIDPPIPAAVREAILSVDDLGRAIGALSGAPLSSLKEVTDRMKQFAGQMYREVKDADGKITKELTSFGEQLVKDATSAIGGMWDTITADGVIDPSDVQAVFEQLAQIPEEVLGDPAVQSSIQSLLAMIGEQTGDAFVIGLSALPEVTKEQLDEALGIYDQWKKDVEDNPPEVAPEVKPPENPDGSPSNPDSVGATGPDTSAATAAPPPAPVPPETVKSWEAITEAAKAYAAAVVEGTTATTALSSEVVTRSAEMLAAIQPIYGTPDDETSLSAINDLLGRVLRQTLDDMTLAIAGATGDWAGSFDFARGAVEMLNTAISELPTDKTITFHVVTDGSIPASGTVCADVCTSHSGELIPGAPGTEALRVLEAGELVLPADLTSRLMHGATLSGADVARIQSSPMASYASSAGASRAPQAASGASVAAGWALVPIREEALIDKALVRLERDMANGYGSMPGGRYQAHPVVHARARRG